MFHYRVDKRISCEAKRKQTLTAESKGKQYYQPFF